MWLLPCAALFPGLCAAYLYLALLRHSARLLFPALRSLRSLAALIGHFLRLRPALDHGGRRARSSARSREGRGGNTWNLLALQSFNAGPEAKAYPSRSLDGHHHRWRCCPSPQRRLYVRFFPLARRPQEHRRRKMTRAARTCGSRRALPGTDQGDSGRHAL
jgi:hypothetical protein